MAVMAWTWQRILHVSNVAPGSVTIRHDVEYSVALLHSDDVISAPRGSDEMITQLLLVFALHRRLCTQTLHTQTHNNRRSTNTDHSYTHTHTTVLRPFFQDHPGEPVPEENFWTLLCKGRLTEADTLIIRLGATPSGLSSAYLHHPPIFFTGRMSFLPPNQHRQSTEGMYHANC